MFKKKKKNNENGIEIVEENISETIQSNIVEEPASKDNLKRNKLASFFNLNKKSEENEETTSASVIHNKTIKDPKVWQWTNNEEFVDQFTIENKKKTRKQRKLEANEGIHEKELNEEPKGERKDLSAFFEDNKDKKKIRKKDKVLRVKKEKKENTHKSKKVQIQEDIKNQKVFRYESKKYTKVEDFITYLNQHYLDIETIAEEVLEDENFFGWVNKNSGIFTNSLKEFKEIKAKIENKS